MRVWVVESGDKWGVETEVIGVYTSEEAAIEHGKHEVETTFACDYFVEEFSLDRTFNKEKNDG